MKERPILFSAPMVQAILAGNKTQTRRVVKGFDIQGPSSIGHYDWFKNGKWEGAHKTSMSFSDSSAADNCPYGQLGDQLWVRETWGYFDPDGTGQDYESPACAKSSEYMMHEDNSCLLDYWLRRIAYKASFKLPEYGNGPDAPKKWHPSIHMPRWASRIQLEITNIRVERLQDISDEDAESEGIESCGRCGGFGFIEQGGEVFDCPMPECGISAATLFERLWKSINGAESWTANPYVWVIEFRKV